MCCKVKEMAAEIKYRKGCQIFGKKKQQETHKSLEPLLTDLGQLKTQRQM